MCHNYRHYLRGLGHSQKKYVQDMCRNFKHFLRQNSSLKCEALSDKRKAPI